MFYKAHNRLDNSDKLSMFKKSQTFQNETLLSDPRYTCLLIAKIFQEKFQT